MMTLNDFRQSLTATGPPAGLSHALAGLWWDAKGTRRTNPLSGTKVPRAIGFTPTCTARKAIGAMRPTGTLGLAGPSAGSLWMRNGSAWSELCWDRSIAHLL